MDEHNISFETILKEYENNSRAKKRMKKLANIEEGSISPFITKGVNEFKKLINQIKDEAERRRRLFL